jgi:hypothetical protein
MQTRRLCKCSQTLKLDVGGISATIFVRDMILMKDSHEKRVAFVSLFSFRALLSPSFVSPNNIES